MRGAMGTLSFFLLSPRNSGSLYWLYKSMQIEQYIENKILHKQQFV